MNLEDVLPMAFPFGIGGPGMYRRTKVSVEVCIQRYFQTAVPQLMRGDVVAVLSYIDPRVVPRKTESARFNRDSAKQANILGDERRVQSDHDWLRSVPRN